MPKSTEGNDFMTPENFDEALSSGLLQPRLVRPLIVGARVKGWKMPENTVCVCRPGRFGNPFLIGPDRTQRQAVDCFRSWLTTPHITAGIPEKKQAILDGLESLRGKNLACFCKPGTACHADVLINLANAR